MGKTLPSLPTRIEMTEIAQPGLFMETPEIIQPDPACVLAGVHPMIPLSPTAQAVLDAYHMRADHEGPKCPEVVLIAEVLRAAADQVASPIPDDCTADVFNRQIKIRDDLLAIAAELDGENSGYFFEPFVINRGFE